MPNPSLAASQPTRNKAIVEFLQLNKERLSALVADNGTIYAVREKQNRRIERALVDLVSAELGQAQIAYISPIEFANWHQSPRDTDQTGTQPVQDTNQLLRHILEQAIEANASDIYLDIHKDISHLSLRCYGFKRPYNTLSREEGLRLATSIFSMGKSTDFQPGRPCDCAFDFAAGDKNYRVRGNSVKDTRGNSLTCRIRDPNFVLPLDACGYSPTQIQHIERMCKSPGGLIVLSGETNSGKSTTLGSLMMAEPRTKKIIEVADPVEIEFDHCTHIEINKYGEQPEEELRNILGAVVRQNPDVLVLGEIRDHMSAAAATDMAIQGKRVYSTLHTQSCISVFPRLVNLGVPRDILVHPSFIAGCVNQNLVPLTCPRCARLDCDDPYQADHVTSLFGSAPLRFVNPEGCAHCKHGVVGQTLVAEVFPMVLDRTGQSHRFIDNNNFKGLEAHMQQSFGVVTKHHHAAGKVMTGLIDPLLTEAIIGEFMEGDVQHPLSHTKPKTAALRP